MRKFSIKIWHSLDIWYNHYLSEKFIYDNTIHSIFSKKNYPLGYCSRKFDKPAWKSRSGSCFWYLDDRWHRVGRPAVIYSDGDVGYFENGERVQ